MNKLHFWGRGGRESQSTVAEVVGHGYLDRNGDTSDRRLGKYTTVFTSRISVVNGRPVNAYGDEQKFLQSLNDLLPERNPLSLDTVSAIDTLFLLRKRKWSLRRGTYDVAPQVEQKVFSRMDWVAPQKIVSPLPDNIRASVNTIFESSHRQPSEVTFHFPHRRK